MNERIEQLARQSGATDPFGEKVTTLFCFTPEELHRFSMLVIQDYENDVRESRREVKSQLGYSRIGRNNV